MAISASTVWEIRSDATAGNVNGGGFVTGASGTDFSQQAAAQYNLTGCTSAAADAIILNASAAADMVGNLAHVISGTNATAGWYEILSVSVGVSITVDRNWGSAAVAAGVVNIGGALSLVSTLDDDFFEAPEAGNTIYIKNGTYVMGETVTTAKDGATQKPIVVEGYNSTRGDKPTGSTRPTLNWGATLFSSGDYWHFKYLINIGTGSNVISCGLGNRFIHVKIKNTSSTADRGALSLSGAESFVSNCECVCYRGYGIDTSTSAGYNIIDSYIHDSNIGIKVDTVTQHMVILNNILVSNITSAIHITGAQTSSTLIKGNTLYGAENTIGIGVNIATGTLYPRIENNIIYGFATGVNHADVQTSGYDSYNAYNNNDTNATNWTLGTGSITTAPGFTSVSQLTGATATTSGSVLTQSGGDFSTVVDGQDYLYLVSGTGITAGVYGITSHTGTTLTLDIAPGTNATADKVWQITTGRNFAIGANYKAAGTPAAFAGGTTTGYTDIGAVQRQEPSAGGSFTFS